MFNAIIPSCLVVSGIVELGCGIRKLKKEGFFQKFVKKPQETNGSLINKNVSPINATTQSTNIITQIKTKLRDSKPYILPGIAIIAGIASIAFAAYEAKNGIVSDYLSYILFNSNEKYIEKELGKEALELDANDPKPKLVYFTSKNIQENVATDAKHLKTLNATHDVWYKTIDKPSEVCTTISEAITKGNLKSIIISLDEGKLSYDKITLPNGEISFNGEQLHGLDENCLSNLPQDAEITLLASNAGMSSIAYGISKVSQRTVRAPVGYMTNNANISFSSDNPPKPIITSNYNQRQLENATCKISPDGKSKCPLVSLDQLGISLDQLDKWKKDLAIKLLAGEERFEEDFIKNRFGKEALELDSNDPKPKIIYFASKNHLAKDLLNFGTLNATYDLWYKTINKPSEVCTTISEAITKGDLKSIIFSLDEGMLTHRKIILPDGEIDSYDKKLGLDENCFSGLPKDAEITLLASNAGISDIAKAISKVSQRTVWAPIGFTGDNIHTSFSSESPPKPVISSVYLQQFLPNAICKIIPDGTAECPLVKKDLFEDIKTELKNCETEFEKCRTAEYLAKDQLSSCRFSGKYIHEYFLSLTKYTPDSLSKVTALKIEYAAKYAKDFENEELSTV